VLDRRIMPPISCFCKPLLLVFTFLAMYATHTAAQVKIPPEMIVSIGHQDEILSSAFSPDNKYLATGSRDQTVKLWEIESGALLRTFTGHTNDVVSVSFSQDGRTLASAADNVLLWDIYTGEQLGTGPPHILGKAWKEPPPGHFSVRSRILDFVSFSPNGLLAISGGSDKLIKLWDARTRRIIQTFQVHDSRVRTAVFSPDSRYVLSGGDDRTALLWDVSTGYPLRFFKGHSSPICSSAFSSDGRLAATGSEDGVIKVWGVVPGMKKKTLVGHRGPVTSLSFTHSNKLLMSASKDHTIKIWSIKDSHELGNFARFPAPINTATISSDERFLATGTDRTFAILWDAEFPRIINIFDGYTSWITSTHFSPDGRYLAIGTRNGIVKLWELAAGQAIISIDCGTDNIVHLRFSNEGRFLLAQSTDKIVSIIDIENRKITKQLSPKANLQGPLTFSSDNKYLAIGGPPLQFLNLQSQQVIWNADRDTESYNSLFFTSNGQLLIGIGNTNIDLWDATSRTFLQRHNTDGLHVDSSNISSDGKHIVAYGSDSKRRPSVAIWSLNETAIKTLGKWYLPKDATSATFIEGKSDIILGMVDGSISIWTKSGHQKRQLVRHRGGTRESSIQTFKNALLKAYYFIPSMITSLCSVDKGARLFSCDSTGLITLWSTKSSKPLIKGAISSDDEWILHSPQGFYNSSPEGGKLFKFRISKDRRIESFAVDQYSPFYYQPEIVKDILLKGRDPTNTPSQHNIPPSVSLYEHMLFRKSSSNKYNLSLSVEDDRMVRTLRIFNNGRPTIAKQINEQTSKITISVPLLGGLNRITAIAFDDKGFSSNPRYVDVLSTRKTDKPSLYVLAVGISFYPNLPSEWNLDYAHTDAENFAKALENQEGKYYGKVHIHKMKNDEALPEKFYLALSRIKKKARDNDLVILFLAGHGIRTEAGEFHFLTTESNLMNLKKGSVNWADLSTELSGIRAKTIIFLDACHSGAISNELIVPNDTLAKQLFSREKGGVLIFSASKARQPSAESSRLDGGSGVFSYALRQALTSKSHSADLNSNGTVEFQELVRFATSFVNKSTGGRQTPWLSRRELFGDFPVAVSQ